MTSSVEFTEDAKIRELAHQYRNEGYEVLIEPSRSSLPFDLGNYRPDLIVQKDQNGIIFEVKTKAERISVDQFRAVAEEVRKHDGWRFMLVTAEDISSTEVLEVNPIQPSWEELKERTKHAIHLAEIGEMEAGFLVLWIVFERLLRLQAYNTALPVDRLAPSIVIRQLYSQGELTVEQFTLALSLQKIRNQVVHGFATSDLRETFDSLNVLIHDLIAEWSSSSTMP